MNENLYISAEMARIRTRNARKSEGYIAKNEVYPKHMNIIMALISDATNYGDAKIQYPYSHLEGYDKNMSLRGFKYVKNEMLVLGYTINILDENYCEFSWEENI